MLEFLHRDSSLSADSVSYAICLGDSLCSAMCHSALLRNDLRVLVVDSNVDSCELLAALFAQYGIETTIATCATEALEKIQQAQPDLLISEIFLPGEDGYSLVHQVKALETALQVQIPAIALTTLDFGEDDRVHSLTAGFFRHLLKPFDFDELMEIVACLTGQVQEMAASACY